MWLGHQPIRQGQVNIMDSMHHLSLGVSDFPDDVIMTGAQFEARFPWPVGRPESQWGEVLLLLMVTLMQKKECREVRRTLMQARVLDLVDWCFCCF